MPEDDALLAEQAAYYRARAPEYDEWWRRLDRYDRGTEATRRWAAEVAEVERALALADPQGDMLELACGTGWWTERLARTAGTLTCLDASPEVMEINRDRLAGAGLPPPTYVQADLFAWRPDRAYDVVFFGFWLSHVPEARFDAFWEAVAAALRPGGFAFLVDSRAEPSSAARDHRPPGPEGVQVRRLNDGQEFHVVKLFREPGDLAPRLARLGWRSDLRATPSFFVHGPAWRA